RALRRLDLLPQEVGLGLEIEVDEQALDGLGAHAAVEVLPEPLPERPVDGVVGDELLDGQALERVQDLVEVLGLPLGALRDALDLALRLAAGGRQLRTLGPLGLEV